MNLKDLETQMFLSLFNIDKNNPKFEKLQKDLKDNPLLSNQDFSSLKMDVLFTALVFKNHQFFPHALRAFREMNTNENAFKLFIDVLTLLEIANGTQINMPQETPASQSTLTVGLDNLNQIRAHSERFKYALKNKIKEQSTISDLAKNIGMSQGSLSRVLTPDKSIPRISTVKKIFKALKIESLEI